MKPIKTMHGFDLWYSPDDGGLYWQRGEWTGDIFNTEGAATKALSCGRNHPRTYPEACTCQMCGYCRQTKTAIPGYGKVEAR